MFLIPSLYILEKNLLVNKYKKQVCYKKNKPQFLWRQENWRNFLFKIVIFSKITGFFLVEKWETLEVARK